METKKERHAYYDAQAERLTADIRRLERRGKLFVAAELSLFGLVILALVAYASWGGGTAALAGAAGSLAAFLFVRWKDAANDGQITDKENLRTVYQKELSYLRGDFACFPAGEEYINPQHEFTFDMDIFGRESLFNRINRTITTGGNDFLAHELAETRQREVTEIADRREAVSELSGREELRTRFLSYGQRKRIDTAQVLAAMQAVKGVHIPQFANTLPACIAAGCAILGFWLTVVLSIFGTLSSNVPIVWGILQYTLVTIVCKNPLHTMMKMVGKIHTQLKAYIRLITTIAESGLTAEENASIIRLLTADGSNALHSFQELEGILDGLDRRANVLGHFIFNTLFLTDFFLVRRFLRWQARYMLRIEEWIAAVSHFDALVSMATFRYNEPDATEAEVIDNEKMIYEATGLYHPFLSEKAVRNDFRIDDGHYYIVTGANMAGKSTFLRSVGINYILALCGMPVFAERLTVSVYSLFSSMRTTDDLAHGISYFNAELLRLRQLMDTCKQNRRTLIILDEILKGTNSLDKLNGSRLFLEAVSALPVTGIIATHDLELSKMEEQYPDRFHNYCFEIGLSDEITYTYKITAGVARNQNATHLLKKILT